MGELLLDDPGEELLGAVPQGGEEEGEDEEDANEEDGQEVEDGERNI